MGVELNCTRVGQRRNNPVSLHGRRMRRPRAAAAHARERPQCRKEAMNADGDRSPAPANAARLLRSIKDADLGKLKKRKILQPTKAGSRDNGKAVTRK
jgi:hypothetical protein